MSSGQARRRERMPHFAASPPAKSYPITISILVLSFTTIIIAQCSRPNCTKPDTFGGGTPSFSPDQDCYAAGTPGPNVSCDGYLFGDPIIGVCVDDYFESDRPHCENSNCGRILVAEDVIVDNPADTSLYDMVTFACDTNLFLDGPTMAWCQGTGLWYPSRTPNCSDYCTTPDIDKGYVTFIEPEYADTPHEGIQITIACDTGYSLTGPSNVTCHTEKWSPDVRECFADCASPLIVNSDYATDQGSTEHADYIIVTCNENFTSGTGYNVSEPLICNNSIWDQTITCYANCPLPSPLVNGFYYESYPFYHSHVIVFSCDPNYTLVGDNSSTCNNGTWTNETRVCKAHCELPVIPNSPLNETGQYVPHGTSVTVVCNEGYYYLYNATHDGTSTCDDGNMNVTDIECVETCDSLTINNSNLDTIPTPIAYWQPVLIDCDDGYTSGTGVDQNETVICTGDSWNTDIYCYANCPNISAPCGGSMGRDSYPFYHGEIVNFSCNDDTDILVGEVNITCNDGEWSYPVPDCKASCPPPPIANATYYDRDPSNGNYTLHGDYADVYCVSGFTSGTGSPINETIYCDGGTFNRTIFCYADCGEVLSPMNGTAYVGEKPHHHGNQANFTCDDNFTLQGNDTVTCEDGDWTPDFPICGRDCSDPGVPANGRQTGDTSYKHQSILGFQCDDGLAVLGAAEIVCMFGTWTEPVPTCYNTTTEVPTTGDTTTEVQSTVTSPEEISTKGIVLTCTESQMIVDIPKSLLTDEMKGSDVRFENEVNEANSDCEGIDATEKEKDIIRITTNLTDCGTKMTETDDDEMIYTNCVVNNYQNATFTRFFAVEIPVSCSYNRTKRAGWRKYQLTDYTIDKSLSEEGQYSFEFDMYKDSNFEEALTEYPHRIALNEELYFAASVLSLDETVDLSIRSCRATPNSNYDNPISYVFIENGCTKNNDTKLTYLADYRIGVEMNTFRFVDKGEFVYIHCDLLVCKASDSDFHCNTDCVNSITDTSARHRRDVSSALNTKRFTRGPLRVVRAAQNSISRLHSIKTMRNIPSQQEMISAMNPRTVAMATMATVVMAMAAVIVLVLRKVNKIAVASEKRSPNEDLVGLVQDPEV